MAVWRLPWFIALIIKVLIGFWALSVATGKGRSGGWFWLAFFFPIIGIIVAYCLEDRSEEYERPYYEPTYVQTVQCPFANGTQTPTLIGAPRAALPSPVNAEDGKGWVICAGCGERATTDYALIRMRCPKCDTPYTFHEEPAKGVADGAGTAVSSAAPEQRRCVACGQPLPVGAAYCMFCGEKAPTGWSCPSCASINPAAAKFCMNCGKQSESVPSA